MRVVEPQKVTLKPNPPKKSRNKRFPVALLFLSLTLTGYFVFKPATKSEAPTVNQSIVGNDDTTVQEAFVDETVETLERTGELRFFTGNEFRLFYDNLLQPELDPIGVPPPITGNVVADARIRQIAEQRGYKLRANSSVDLPTVQGYRLHEAVHQPWLDLQSSAQAAGHNISIVSAYRSVDDQRQLFTSRLQAEGVNIDNVAAGIADEEINTVLVTSSIPGYSKHHTGYTIDILCAGFAFENFKNSTCHDWLMANNYEQAKTYGFIPSYPTDADLQGPEPEAWEYVYVGADLLRQ